MDNELIEDIYNSFMERYGFDQDMKFARVEKEFLATLSPKQKDLYFKLLYELFSYEKKLDLKLISFTFGMEKVREWQEQD